MGDVRRVVHAQPDAHDQQHRGCRVHRQAPEVHEPHHIDQGEDDADQDEDGAGDVGEHEDHDDEHAGQGKDNAPEQLDRKDPFNLPELVSGKKPKSSESVYIRLTHLSEMAKALPSIPASDTSCFTLSIAGTCSVGPEKK